MPKRSDELIRRNIPEHPIDKVTAIGVVPIPETLGITNPHPLIRDLWDSLKDSAQARFYEPSDWQYARLTLHFANKLVRSSKPSAMLLNTVNTMLTSLLLTEGDRRRVRLEIERKSPGQGDQKPTTVSDMFRGRLGAG